MYPIPEMGILHLEGACCPFSSTSLVRFPFCAAHPLTARTTFGPRCLTAMSSCWGTGLWCAVRTTPFFCKVYVPSAICLLLRPATLSFCRKDFYTFLDNLPPTAREKIYAFLLVDLSLFCTLATVPLIAMSGHLFSCFCTSPFCLALALGVLINSVAHAHIRHGMWSKTIHSKPRPCCFGSQCE